MDERIDLTERRDFRNSSPLPKNQLKKSSSTNVTSFSIRGILRNAQRIPIHHDEDLKTAEIDNKKYFGKKREIVQGTCARCGKKTFEDYGLCSECSKAILVHNVF